MKSLTSAVNISEQLTIVLLCFKNRELFPLRKGEGVGAYIPTLG